MVEDAELMALDRILVFDNGRITEELPGEAITELAIVSASFVHIKRYGAVVETKESSVPRILRRIVEAAPFVGLVRVVAVMVILNPRIASVFGLDLLLLPEISLVLVNVAQMFIVGGSEINLGVGAVIACTFVISSLLAFLLGVVLGAFVGCAIPRMGRPFLLQTIARCARNGEALREHAR